MSENSKIEFYELNGQQISLHPIYCACERCVTCIHCHKPEREHYHGATGIYCIGFYDGTKKFTPRG